MKHNGLGYESLRGLALNFVSTHQAKNPRGFSEVGEKKQLLITIVVLSLFNISIFDSFKNASFNSDVGFKSVLTFTPKK